MARIHLGPFVLDAPIGRGGMGEVWRGHHGEQGIPVAVKVLSARPGRDDARLAAFRDEIHAIAGLDHPNIVTVLDAGTVDAAAARASGRRLPEGNPYLVMELSTGGTLADLRVDGWSRLRDVLLTLLDALAHAHARGVVHLDLKPGNVLLPGPDDLRPGLKLTDFGIASALEETQESQLDAITGTLSYMAPEQIRAEWRDYGPWTDLYALGCLAWRLAVGRLPFTQRNPVALMRAQLTLEAPRLVDVPFPVPAGLDRWVARLLEKVPWRRFHCAPDAAAALRALGEPVDGPVVVDEDTFAELPTLILRAVDPDEGHHTSPIPVTGCVPLDASPSPADRPPGAAGPLDTRPKLPADWRRPGPEVRSPRLVGAGLGLYGVRALPVVGREAERDALWAALTEVHRVGSARLVTIRGAAGTGTTVLARWVVERAREVGAANALHYRFEPGAPADEGLRLLLRRFFRVQRLTPEARRARIRDVLVRHGAERPDELAPAVDAILDEQGAPNRRARYVAIRQIFEAIASERPLVVWFDDVQWGIDALRLVDHLLAAGRGRPSPLLLLLSYRNEAVAERPAEANRLRLLEARRDTRRVVLGPLGPADHARLARTILPLSPTLAARAAERTSGNPQLLHDLVEDWVARDQLVFGAGGFELRGPLRIPPSLDAAWRIRLLRLLEDLPDEARVLLERAAVLGREVDDHEWQLVCDDPDGRWARVGRVYFRPRRAGLRGALRSRLVAARIAEPTDAGWTFAHAMARHTLEQMAREGGRWAAHHRACATMLRGRAPLAPGDHERLGRHLVEAGEVEEAYDALLVGVDHRETTVGFRAALGLLAWAEERLAGALPAEDPRWGRLWCRRAALFADLEDVSASREWAQRAWDAAARHAWPDDVRARAAFELGKAALYERRGAEVERWLGRAVELASPDDALLHGSAWFSRSVAARFTGEVVRARAFATRAAVHLARAARRGSPDGWRMLGNLALLDHDLDRARGYLRQALAWAEGRGDQVEIAEACNALAELDRKRGRLDRAEEGLRRSIALYEQAGAADQALYPLANLGLVHLARGDWRAAREVATALRAEVEWRNRDALVAAAHGILAAAALGVRAWDDAGHHLDRCGAVLAAADIVEEDLAWTLELAHELARSADRPGLEEQAISLARSQRARLGVGVS